MNLVEMIVNPAETIGNRHDVVLTNSTALLQISCLGCPDASNVMFLLHASFSHFRL